MQTFASDIFVRDNIESFEINGLTLNSSVEELEALVKGSFKCSTKERFGVSYWTCRSFSNKKAKTTLKISVDNQEIVSIHLHSQMTKNSADQLNSQLSELNQRLLKEGVIQTGRNVHSEDIFFYHKDESPVMPNTYMTVKTTLECSIKEPVIFGLQATLMALGNTIDVNVSAYKMQVKQC
ncbi:hypothetical protein Q4489_14530 [Thalassotalea sp. 1_MG-2023]|uniref:hypothetical protein n=1 Tax=Thalassotalea sp. 1_MG-2023 TaxID=3062680 RepID=UPI0026E179DC|nr:hypothetical protein [Thalassotalea sp. 1_MG-2023]MDO6428234.1 hypothetical protein [Thalassotalea sp. 1_MG-2023]